jgi:hypothetical protein
MIRLLILVSDCVFHAAAAGSDFGPDRQAVTLAPIG